MALLRAADRSARQLQGAATHASTTAHKAARLTSRPPDEVAVGGLTMELWLGGLRTTLLELTSTRKSSDRHPPSVSRRLVSARVRTCARLFFGGGVSVWVKDMYGKEDRQTGDNAPILYMS